MTDFPLWTTGPDGKVAESRDAVWLYEMAQAAARRRNRGSQDRCPKCGAVGGHKMSCGG